MWIVVWRPLVVLFGVGGMGAAAMVTSAISLDAPASNTLMIWVFFVMAFQATISVGLIVYGAWGPIKRWLGGAQHAP